MITIEIIPFKTFKQKLEIVKEYIGKGKVSVVDSFVMVEQIDYRR